MDGGREYKPTNREKVKQSKQGKYWCSACDAQEIHDGEKCPNCGVVNRVKSLKKYHCSED